jgi:hypothetical protein
MSHSTRQTFETSALILLSALLFTTFFHLNGWVFAHLEYRQGVNWVFLPAGFRVILVMVMGIPASVGIMLGAWFIERAAFETTHYTVTLFNGVASGFTPWFVMKALVHCKKLAAQLQHLSSAQLLNFTLIYAASNAAVHQLGWWWMDHAQVNPLVDIWPMLVGDTVGALIMLYAFKGLLALRKTTAPLHPDSDGF